jgi:hypothetical protein
MLRRTQPSADGPGRGEHSQASGVGLVTRVAAGKRHDSSIRRPEGRADQNARWGLVAFVAIEIAAFLIFFQVGKRSWFRFDDWRFLAGRTAGDVHDLLAPHIDHWSTTPVLTYRTLWQLFGLRFAPYLVTAIALHVTSAALLRIVMRRAGVGPWIATAAASLFALFGVGYETTTRLMALNFAGWPIVFGLTYLILIDHDGSFDWRDGLGMAAGLGALASSGLGIPMIVAVGVAALVRRGPRISLQHMVPLGVLYATWYIAYGPRTRSATATETASFAFDSARGVFVELGQSNAVAVVLGVLLLLGLVLAWSPLSRRGLRVEASLPIGLIAGLVAFLILTGYGRGDFPETARLSHYMDAAAVMLLPAIAVAAQAIAHRSSVLALAVPLVFVVGIPGNVATLIRAGDAQELYARRTERTILSVPRHPLAERIPRKLSPEPIYAAPVTVGWLLDGLADGRIPAPPSDSPRGLSGQIELRLSLQQTNRITDWSPCIRVRVPVIRELRTGEHISLGRGFVRVSLLREGAWTSAVRFGDPFGRFARRWGETLTAVRGPLTLRISPVRGADNWVCG